MYKNLKRICATVHLYGGLWFGILIILLSLTGSILVFEHEIDRFLNPGLIEAPEGGRRAVAMDRLAERIKENYPDKTVRFINLPRTDRQNAEFWLGKTPPHTYVYVNPHTGKIAGSRKGRGDFIKLVFDLHQNLLGGYTGSIIVGISGIILLLIALSGIVLWWPKIQNLKRSISIAFGRKLKRINYDLHRAVGFWTALFLILTAGTGTALVFYAPMESFLQNVLNERQPSAAEVVSGLKTTPPDQRLEGAVEKATSLFPQSKPTYLYLPQSDRDVITVRLRQPSEWHPNGRTFVYLDQYRLTVLHSEDALSAPASARLMNLMYPLHIGSFGGLPVKWGYFILGLAPTLLSITGVIIWYLRKKNKRKKSRTNT